MPNQDKLRGIKERIFIHRMLGISTGTLAVFLFTFAIIPNLVLEASATQDVSVFASWSPVSLTLDPDYGSSDTTSARGNVVFGSITPTSRDTSSGSYGTQRVIKKTIGITSNGTYYTVFLSTSGSNNSLALDMENTDLSIPAIGNGSTTGVWSNPVAFSASGWGFSVPSTTIPASADTVGTSASSTPPAFTNVVTGANLGKDLTKALDSSIYNQDIWSAVPSSSTPQQIWKATSTSTNGFGTYTNSNNVEVTGDLVNDHFDIYYGIMVDTDVLSGTYENEIVYTALASATSLDDVSTNLSRETYIIANGTEQTLHFDLSSSLANPTNIINKDNITIYLVPHATVASANYELTSTIKNAASTYTTCTIGSNDDITITGDGNGATITCTSPDNTPADGTGLGEFDYWLHIDGYNYNYLSHYKKNEQDTASVAYIGLQSKLTDSNNQLVITEMQEMTGSVCKNTNIWNNQVGDDARIMDYSGTTQLVADIMTTDEETGEEIVDGAATSEASATQGIGTFALIDNRDNKDYLVRRYYNGACWLVQNLGLKLADFVGTELLTSNNTDLNTKDYWDPGESMYNLAKTIDSSATHSNYFEIASAERLGDTQSAQYNSLGDGIFYAWGSYYKYNSDTDTKGDTTENPNNNNELSAIPRSFYLGNYYSIDKQGGGLSLELDDQRRIWERGSLYPGAYYNWYAATAESGNYSSANGVQAEDSICPKGWQLQVSYSSNPDKSLYTYMKGLHTSDFVGKLPYELRYSGYYEWATSTSSNYINHIYATGRSAGITYSWTTQAYNRGQANFVSWYSGSNTPTQSSNNKTIGFVVRCVARD